MKKFNAYLMWMVIVFFVISCKNQAGDQPDVQQKYCVSDTLMKLVKVDTAKYTNEISELKLIGKVTSDEDQVVRVYPLVSGNVKEVKVTLGDYVTRGQELALIKSAESSGIASDLVNAQANVAAAKKNLAAVEDEYKGGVASQTDYQLAQNDEIKAEAELKRVQNIISMNEGNSTSDYMVKAPVSGFIIEKNINANQMIRPDNSNDLFTVSDLNRIWVMADVYETDISRIRLGDEVEVTTIAYPDKVFTGKISKIYDVLDPDNKTLKVRIALPNPGYLLKPEMFASIKVIIRNNIKMLTIPSNAVVFDKNRNYVVAFNTPCDVKAKEVAVAGVYGKSAYISSGLQPGDRIISRYQLLIYTALSE